MPLVGSSIGTNLAFFLTNVSSRNVYHISKLYFCMLFVRFAKINFVQTVYDCVKIS